MSVLRIGTVVGFCVFVAASGLVSVLAHPPNPPQAPQAGKFRDPYPKYTRYNLAELTEEQYQTLLRQLKDQHEPGVLMGLLLATGGSTGLGYIAYRRYVKADCGWSLLSQLRIASPSLFSIISGIYMLRYTQISYNRQKLLLSNLRNAIAPTSVEQIETINDLLREFFAQSRPVR